MASIIEPSIKIEEMNSSVRKEVIYTFSVDSFPLADNLETVLDYKSTFQDDVEPTRWNLSLKFIKEIVEENIACIYTVRRADSVDRRVMVSLRIEFFNSFETRMSNPRGFYMVNAVKDQVIKNTVYPVLHYRDLNRLPNEILIVKARLCIDCWQTVIEKGDTETGLSGEDSIVL